MAGCDDVLSHYYYVAFYIALTSLSLSCSLAGAASSSEAAAAAAEEAQAQSQAAWQAVRKRLPTFVDRWLPAAERPQGQGESHVERKHQPGDD